MRLCDHRTRDVPSPWQYAPARRFDGHLTRAQRTVRATVLRWIGAERTSAPTERTDALPRTDARRALRRTRSRSLTTTGGAQVELVNVSKNYGNVHAVTNLSLTVEPGRFLTLLGPSGSGKTTVLQLIAGLIEPTAGAIWINGAPTEGIPPDRRNVGVVFQHYALFPHLTVAQNLAFPLEMRHLSGSEIRNRVADALDLVGLTGLENRRPRQLSGGQQQRVALARALIYRPSVILMDEPLGALDKNLRQQMQVEIKKIQADLGLTMIYVTHDQAEALAMSDEICVIEGGQLAQVGPPRQLYDRPVSEFVATFLGEANLFAGKISEVETQTGVARAAGPSGLQALGRLGSDSGGDGVGEPVTIIVRPEDVQIGSARSGPPGFEARVESVAFVGDALRVQLTADGRTSLVAKLPKTSAHPPKAGSAVNVSWREQDATFVKIEREKRGNDA